MTDAEKLSTLSTAALYQQQLDQLTRARDEAKASMDTYNGQIATKTAQLDALWKSLRTQVGSGS
jgi:hypothetical protein